MPDLERTESPLYRCFDRAEHANAFSCGSFRLGSIRRYRDIESAVRRDSAEGLGHFIDKDGDRYAELGNEVFLLCLSMPNVDLELLKRSMGKHVVRVADVEALGRDIAEGMQKLGVKIFGEVKGRKVRYDKADVLEVKNDPMVRAELSVIQKPRAFECEREYRYLAIVNRNPPNWNQTFLELNLGRRLEYVDIV